MKYLLIISALALLFSKFFLELSWTHSAGLAVTTLLVLIIITSVYKKFSKKEGLRTDSFVFSDGLADKMKNVSVEIQLETSVISVLALLIGMIAFNIYTLFFAQYELIIKIFITFNSVFGIILLGSMLVTNFQQLTSYKESTKFINQYAQSKENKENYNHDTYY